MSDTQEKRLERWRYVKIGSEGIAIKPDTGDLKTDMQTVAMCGLNENHARLIASAPQLAEALEAAERMPVVHQETCGTTLPCAYCLIQRQIQAALKAAREEQVSHYTEVQCLPQCDEKHAEGCPRMPKV